MKSTLAVALVIALAGCSKKDDKAKAADPPPKAADMTAPPTTPPPTTPPQTTPAKVEVPCKNDTNKHVDNGVLSSCILSADHQVGELTCSANKMAYFYPSGALKECHLTAAVTLAGFSCKDSTGLYDDGSLRRCKIEADKEHGGVKLAKGDWVSIYKHGTLHRAEVGTRTVSIAGHDCTGYLNYFHPNGTLKNCVLAADTEKLKKGESICFDDTSKRVADCQALDWTDLVE